MKRRYAASTIRARVFRERSRRPSTAIPPSFIEAKIAREPPPQIAVDILRTICRVALYLVVGGVTPHEPGARLAELGDHLVDSPHRADRTSRAAAAARRGRHGPRGHGRS